MPWPTVTWPADPVDSARRSVETLARSALDLLFPLSCAVCQREGRFLCDECVEKLPALERPYCPTCSRPGSRFMCQGCHAYPLRTDSIKAAFVLEGPVREMVYGLKYRLLQHEMGRMRT